MGYTTVFEALHKSKLLSAIALDRLGDYFELLRLEMKIQGRNLGAQLLGYAIAAVFALLAALFIGVAIILTYWDTPHRATAAWLVVVLYVVVAGIAYAFSSRPLPGSAFETLRSELRRDVETVKESI